MAAKKSTDLAAGGNIIGNVLIDPTAKVSETAILGPDVVVGPDCVVEAGARIMSSSILGSGKVRYANNNDYSSFDLKHKCAILRPIFTDPAIAHL